MQIEFICFLNFDSSTCRSRDIKLLVTEILPVLSHFLYSKSGGRGTVCWELTIFLAMTYPYQITIKIIQRVSNIAFCMLERAFSPKNCII